MATPTYSTVISQINTYIVANGNNEITANVLNPILQIMTDFANNNIGDLSTLTTDQTNNLVVAINSLKQNINDISNNSIKLFTGNDTPQSTPPTIFNYGDFYMELDFIDNTPIQLWQWNGFNWVKSNTKPTPQRTQITNLTTNPQDFLLPSGALPSQVVVNNIIVENWSNVGNLVTLSYPLTGEGFTDKVVIYYQI